jgi:hypothetical protein
MKLLLLIISLLMILLACGGTTGEPVCSCHRLEVTSGDELKLSECVRQWSIVDGVLSYVRCSGLPTWVTYGNTDGVTVLQKECCYWAQ